MAMRKDEIINTSFLDLFLEEEKDQNNEMIKNSSGDNSGQTTKPRRCAPFCQYQNFAGRVSGQKSTSGDHQ